MGLGNETVAQRAARNDRERERRVERGHDEFLAWIGKRRKFTARCKNFTTTVDGERIHRSKLWSWERHGWIYPIKKSNDRYDLWTIFGVA